MAEQAEGLCVRQCGRMADEGLAVCCLHCSGGVGDMHSTECDRKTPGVCVYGCGRPSMPGHVICCPHCMHGDHLDLCTIRALRQILGDLIERTSGHPDEHVREANGVARERLRELEGKEKEVES